MAGGSESVLGVRLRFAFFPTLLWSLRDSEGRTLTTKSKEKC